MFELLSLYLHTLVHICPAKPVVPVNQFNYLNHFISFIKNENNL